MYFCAVLHAQGQGIGRNRIRCLYLAVGLDLTLGAAGAPRFGPQHEPQRPGDF